MRAAAAMILAGALVALCASPVDARRNGKPSRAAPAPKSASPGVKDLDEKDDAPEKASPWGGFYGGLNSGRALSDEGR